MSDYRGWTTLREIDQQGALAKGSAFRAFRRIEPSLQEPRDFRLLDHARDAAEIAELKRAGRVYASSVNVVLLSPESLQKLHAQLAHAARA